MIKHIKLNIILLTILINTNILFSQVQQEWTARYSGLGNSIDGGSSVLIDNANNVIVGGSSSNSMNNDYTIIKYEASGVQKWLATYNGTGNGHDILNSMILDDSGNVYVTGSSIGVATSQDFATVKFNNLGIQQWVVRFTSSGTQDDAGYRIALDKLGNIYVSGESYNNVTLGRDYCTIKYNSYGILQWIRQYSGGIVYDLIIDDSSNVYITGGNLNDIITIKYNSSGTQKWVSRYNGQMNQDDFALSIGIDSLLNVYVSGSSVENTNIYGGYVIVKYNSLGNEQWVRFYEGSGNFLDVARAMKVDKSGNAYVTGYSTESGQGYNMTTIKYNTYGDTLWSASYHNGLNDIANAITLDIDGNIYVTGESDGNGIVSDYTTIKYNSLGKQQWVKRYDYSGQYGDVPTAIIVDNIRNVYVTGSSNRDFLTIKYSQLTGATINLSEIPSNYKLFQNYPNPFNPTTNLGFEIFPKGQLRGELTLVTLKVYDVLGNEVAVLVNEKKNVGSYSIKFDGNNLTSGIYFYSLSIDGNIMDTKRMILLK